MNITLIPFAGLCNRLNAIVCAQTYHKERPEDRIEIFWHKYPHCNCRFSDLFKQIEKPHLPVNELYCDIRKIPGTRLNLHIPQYFRKLWYDVSLLEDSVPENFFEETKGKENVYVFKDNLFCRYWSHECFSQWFHPTDKIQTRIDQITADWDENVIGLHIRRTDHVIAIKNSPIQHFYDVIEAEIAQNEAARFYLATDDTTIKEELRQHYGSRIISPELKLQRYTRRGMEDAVVDLFCLGKTARIYGSVGSSYSQFASHLYNIPLIV